MCIKLRTERSANSVWKQSELKRHRRRSANKRHQESHGQSSQRQRSKVRDKYLIPEGDGVYPEMNRPVSGLFR